MPSAAHLQAAAKPIYECLEGWSESTKGARSWAQLPATAIKYIRRIEELIQPLRDSGEIVSTFENAGQNGAYNSGFMVMTLAPWDKRERSQHGDCQESHTVSVRSRAAVPSRTAVRVV